MMTYMSVTAFPFNKINYKSHSFVIFAFEYTAQCHVSTFATTIVHYVRYCETDNPSEGL